MTPLSYITQVGSVWNGRCSCGRYHAIGMRSEEVARSEMREHFTKAGHTYWVSINGGSPESVLLPDTEGTHHG